MEKLMFYITFYSCLALAAFAEPLADLVMKLAGY